MLSSSEASASNHCRLTCWLPKHVFGSCTLCNHEEQSRSSNCNRVCTALVLYSIYIHWRKFILIGQCCCQWFGGLWGELARNDSPANASTAHIFAVLRASSAARGTDGKHTENCCIGHAWAARSCVVWDRRGRRSASQLNVRLVALDQRLCSVSLMPLCPLSKTRRNVAACRQAMCTLRAACPMDVECF